MSSYVAIRSEGGLIPFETIEKIVRKELPGQADADFALENGKRLSDEIARAWSDALDYWHIFRRRMEALSATDPGTTLTRERWVLLLLTDLMGHELTYQPAGAQIGDKTYPISHRAGEGEEVPPVHIVGFRQDLDRRDESGHRRMSPHALVQEYVNRSEHLWAIVTNGLRFRLLRDTTRTARPTYLEFDMQSILEGSRFNEFTVFYRLCHRTRLPKTVADAKDCLLEHYYQASVDEGLRIRDQLRDAVEIALRGEGTLKGIGTGLLQHPSNDVLLQKVASGQLTPDTYYRQLLRLVYRLLFLMVAEERQMVLVPGADSERRQLVYERFYSLRRLRDLAERPIEETLHDDVWTGLRETFRLFTNGRENPLGIPPLNGDLFGTEAIPDLDGTYLYNHDLLVAIRHMSVFETDGAPARVNYAGLDVEELGSVYESLLDYHPTIERQNGALAFELKTGTERKSTGSYYTPRELVSELVDSALVPVLEDRLSRAREREDKEQAILTMTVCDPACGSGHFLLAAARRMARELARVRSGEDEPTPEEFRRALRDVTQHCLFGVDKNPLAVDLCKVALWIEGHNPGFPLSFLDHRIKCGDSLVGMFSLEQLAEGIPDEAYAPVFGDAKEVAKKLGWRNAKERESQGRQLPLAERNLHEHVLEHATAYSMLAGLPQETVAQVHEMERRYREIHGEGSSWWRSWVAANLWTAAFFIPLTTRTESRVPTTDHVRDWLADIAPQDAILSAAADLAFKMRFFHWPLEFPEVFARGGFDVVLGNPPWERLKLEEEEFFAQKDPRIAKAPKDERRELIGTLPKTNPAIYEAFAAAKSALEGQSQFIRGSGRFPLTSVGELNTYAPFVELGVALATGSGFTGFVVPSSISTGHTYRDFFSKIIESRQLASLYDFDNHDGLFPGVHRQTRFCLLTISNSHLGEARFAFFLRHSDHLRDERRILTMPPTDIELFNPNTKTAPIFRTRTDMDLTRKIYKRFSVLVNEATGANPWEVTIRRVFDINNKRTLALMKREPGPALLPVYESKMLYQFDHRYATYADATVRARKTGDPRESSDEEKADSHFSVQSRHWILRRETLQKLGNLLHHSWMIAFRDVTNVRNERTTIAAVLPVVATDYTIRLLFSPAPTPLLCCLLANLNTLVLDYCTRQAMGSEHLAEFVAKQLPLLAPSYYSSHDIEWITPRVVELTYTATDLEPFAKETGWSHAPSRWDPSRRGAIAAEIDAYFAHLYRLGRDELRYLLDPNDVSGDDFPSETFRVLKEREEREYGEYRTRRLVLEAFDELAKTSRFGGIASVAMSHNPLRKDG